jgi:hypothetical protein
MDVTISSSQFSLLLAFPFVTDAVSKHRGLKQIYLRGNPLDAGARSALERVAQHHPSLVIFV